MKARRWPKWSPTFSATACSCIRPITPTLNPAFRSPPTRYWRGNLWAMRSCEKCSGTTRRDASESRKNFVQCSRACPDLYDGCQRLTASALLQCPEPKGVVQGGTQHGTESVYTTRVRRVCRLGRRQEKHLGDF